MFDEMNYHQLKIARDQIDALMQERRQAALKDFMATAEAMSIDFQGIFAGMNMGVPAKYKDGNGNSWSGRGRKPAWVREAEESGTDIEGLRVTI